MAKIKSLPLQYALVLILGPSAWYIGKQLDKKITLRMTRFRDKSALYGRELQPGEPPSWP
ncbi:PREDICTED: NADH dehydrogenase [ubiquinone] 1 beta subcomplex subunit 1 [Habropoda laboriosa]|uniref:NADH dehydrogenase [ubiquinone] 1 beta subcomplex subunit 1 n=1 Tax=Habropoda laboriosa TaxID=597456 RepID=UPI00083E416F|nr:PREDICTED: NADH dehydrogenase [ubiquinone] 1 beta subcomplex subunit 1 [Habropoda laboriosa]